ncbi:MAG: L-threonylcarbamoyladenylate synthase, partial [Dethiobacteria bacterium]
MTSTFKRVNGTLLLDNSYPALARAVSIIRRGGLVAFPTETVYGLGASATDSNAVNNIFLAKGRPSDNPLIVHISSINQLTNIARDIPETAFLLAEKFWPGALSIVLTRSEIIPPEVSAGLRTVAVRMPDHKVALDLIRMSGVPIAAPSANRSGRPSPTSYRHVLEDLAGRIDAVIKDDDCSIGVESTVIDLSGPVPVILRPGGVSREELESVLKLNVKVSAPLFREGIPSSPGMKYRHYSPKAPLILVTGDETRRMHFAEKIADCYRRKGQ